MVITQFVKASSLGGKIDLGSREYLQNVKTNIGKMLKKIVTHVMKSMFQGFLKMSLLDL